MVKDKKVIQLNIREIIHLVEKEKDLEKLREITYSLIDEITSDVWILIKVDK